MIRLFEDRYSSSSWRARTTALVIVVSLHIGLLIMPMDSKIDAPIDPPQAVHVLDIPFEPPPQPEIQHTVELLAPDPPNVPAPEISIEDAPVVALTDDRMLEAAIPSAAESGAGQQSAAGNAGDGNGSGTDVFAKCTNRVMPIFPIDAKVRNEQGRVVLLVELDERGRFASIEVARSSGSRSLDAAGIAAIKRWKCSPVYEHGRPVRVFAKQEFEFTLR